MSPKAPGSMQNGGRKRLMTVISQAVRQLRDGRGSSAKQILAWVEKNPTVSKQVDEARLKYTLKKGVETGVLTCRGGRYRLAAKGNGRQLWFWRFRRRPCRDRRPPCCNTRRRRSSKRRRRRSCRPRRRSCRRPRRRSCRRKRRRSCRRRRRRSCRRRPRRPCRRRRRRRRPSCCPRPPRRRRSCRRRRRRCSSDLEAGSLASGHSPGGQNTAGSGQPPQYSQQQS